MIDFNQVILLLTALIVAWNAYQVKKLKEDTETIKTIVPVVLNGSSDKPK